MEVDWAPSVPDAARRSRAVPVPRLVTWSTPTVANVRLCIVGLGTPC